MFPLVVHSLDLVVSAVGIMSVGSVGRQREDPYAVMKVRPKNHCSESDTLPWPAPLLQWQLQPQGGAFVAGQLVGASPCLQGVLLQEVQVFTVDLTAGPALCRPLPCVPLEVSRQTTDISLSGL